MDCLTKFDSPQLKTLHSGKVRDSIRIDDKTRMIVVTDRISAFNKKIKTAIPTKGAVLNGIANFWFEETKHIIDNHVIEQIDASITLVKEAEPLRVEMVVRGYLTGSMWRGYEKGKRQISDVVVPDGMVKNQKFDQPILTPTTKDDIDSEINEQGIVEGGLVTAEIYQQMKTKAIELFTFGSEFLAARGIVLVDTKYEFGLLEGQLILIDEIHTPDSSRFWSLEDYKKNPATAEQIDKEFVRQWMLANKVKGEVPTILSPEVVVETSRRYQEIYKAVTGTEFSLVDLPTKVRVYNNLVKAGIIRPGFVAIIMDDEDDLEDCTVLKELVEAYDICVDLRVISADRNGARIPEVAAIYNTSIEPVAVIVVGPPSLGTALMANLGVPVIDGMEAPMDSVLRAAVSSLNIHAIRAQIAQEIIETRQYLDEADAAIRNV